MVKHIGIVACSAEGAALCYKTICEDSQKFLGEFNHPEITMHTPPFSEYMNLIYNSDWEMVGDLMLKSTEIVYKAGADFAICPDNTIHEAFELFISKSPIPWYHIAAVVGEKAKEKGYKKIGILGTKYLMNSFVYPKYLNKLGIECIIPNSVDQEEVNRVIFKELVNGVFKEQTRLFFNNVIERLKDSGCDAVVLGCTEIPLIVQSDDCPLPTLDSTRLLARKAIQIALND